MLKRTLISTICLILVLANAAHCNQSGYYRDTQRGWWWGEREVAPEPEEEKEKEPEKPVAEEKKPSVPPPLSAYKYEDIWNMHPDEFSELRESYLKKAVQNPTEENTKDYYELSEISRKKAAAFTNASQYVWQKHPELATIKDYPINTPGNLSRQRNILQERRQILTDNKEQYALIYFWKPDCPYCEDQKKILKWFEGQNNWIVKHVNVDQNPQTAARVGVTIIPSIVLIKKGNKDHFPISAGVVSAEEIEDKAYRAVKLLNGELTPQDYSIYDFQRGGGFDINSRQDWVK